MSRRARACAAAVAALTVALAGCGEPPGDDSADVASAGFSTVTFRLWDEAAADAYRESFDAFNAINPGLHVEVEVVPRETYADAAATDLADGTMADIFWTTSDAVGAQAHSGDLLGLGTTLGEDHEEWEPALIELYTRDGELWAVPQLWEAAVLFYNTDLAEQSGVDPTVLTWDPAEVEETEEPATETAELTAEEQGDEGDEPAAPDTEAPTPEPSTDTLREAVRTLTRDTTGRSAADPDFDAGAVAEYGYNTDLTSPAVWLPFLAQLGAAPDDDELALDSPESRAAFAYLADLPAAPADSATLTSRQLFTSGRLALYQSTSADMRHLQAHAQVDWDMAPVPAGPDGPVTVVDGVGAAANAASQDPEATAEVLRWLASTDGQSALASHSVGVPAATGAQELYRQAWSDRGVDVTAALEADAVTSASGPEARAVLEAVRPVLAALFRGELEMGAALAAAQSAADEVLGS